MNSLLDIQAKQLDDWDEYMYTRYEQQQLEDAIDKKIEDLEEKDEDTRRLIIEEIQGMIITLRELNTKLT